MDHPFQTGETYRNRHGRYQVMAIEEPKMRIRYEDGREAVVSIAREALAWRMWQNIPEQELKPVAEHAPRKSKQRKPASQGYDFSGLQESDFKNNVAGTHWRSRDSLGGRLAQHLSETTPYEFQSYAISRRPSVHLYLLDHYDPDNGIPYAKYELRLSPEGALYGFYVERADQSRAMDSTWHWRPFLQAVAENQPLQAELQKAMNDLGLFWLLQMEEGEGKNYDFVQQIKVTAGNPLLWAEADEIDWSEFAGRLRAIPQDRWLNVHLMRWTDNKEAIAAGEQFAETVTQTFRAVLPLYLASVGLK